MTMREGESDNEKGTRVTTRAERDRQVRPFGYLETGK